MDKYKLKFENNNSKYIQIYNHIKQLIVQGQIKEHEKLPPIRKLADYINVNNATIVKVYELLEKEGYVYKIIGSGTFVSSVNIKKEVKSKEYKDFVWPIYLNKVTRKNLLVSIYGKYMPNYIKNIVTKLREFHQ